MRLGIGITVMAAIAALGCDSPAPTPDGGGQPGVDSGPRVDAGGGTDDGGPSDSGTPAPDAGPVSCSTTLPALAFEEIAPGAWGSRLPVAVVQPPGEDEDLYVVDQRGSIVIVRDGSVVSPPFLNLGSTGLDRTDSEGAPNSERGLLGLAFHPDYATNGRFFVYYTADEGSLKNVVAEYHADGDVADADEVRRLVDIDDPEWNHNGGMIAFGPDDRLYVGTGDGGGGGDLHGPTGNGQNRNTLLGKILRLDVDRQAEEFAAAGNPFSGSEGLPQIWAYGLRNPWRFSFDRMTGDLWIGDVGQNEFEEIDFQRASSTGGENYGWARYEGFEVYRPTVPEPAEHAEPVLVYDHSGREGVFGGVAVTGGYVYRGAAIPDLRGWYVFADYVGTDANRAPVGALRLCDGEARGVQQVNGLRGALNIVTSFGQDNSGELYMTGDGVVRIVAP